MRRYLGLLLSICLVGLLLADAMQITRASGLSAVACVPTYFGAEPRVPEFVGEYRDVIADRAERYDLPAELLAAVIVNHQAKITAFDRFTDCIGSALGANVSIGLSQVRLSTAALLDGTKFDALAAEDYRTLRGQLMDPSENITYQARELRALLERGHRFPGIGADELVHKPSVMALLVTEYRMGRMATPSDSSRLSGAAFDALRWIERGSVDLFGRSSSDTRRIKTEVRTYLHYIYCDSRIFNASACESWKGSLAAARAAA